MAVMVPGDQVLRDFQMPGTRGRGVLVLGGGGAGVEREPQAIRNGPPWGTAAVGPVPCPQAHPVREHIPTGQHHCAHLSGVVVDGDEGAVDQHDPAAQRVGPAF